MFTSHKRTTRTILMSSALTLLILMSGLALWRAHKTAAAALVFTTITVNSAADAGGTCPGASCTLRQAIATANPSDTIDFGITGTITLASELAIDKDLTIQGSGANLLTVSGNHAARVFNIGSVTPGINVTLSGLTIANGRVTFVAQEALFGGGILNNSTGTLAITNCTLSGNSILANSNGGFASGGGIDNHNTGTLNVTGSTLTGNNTFGIVSNGGGIYNHTTGTVNVTGSTLTGNVADSNSVANGGGIENRTTGTLTITNSTISGNTASGNVTGKGGGVDNNSTGMLTIINTTLSGNIASGINGASNGGGIYNSGPATITGCMLSGNSATTSTTQDGGGIYTSGTTVNITNCTLFNNSAGSIDGANGHVGGGISNWGTVNVTNCTIYGNVSNIGGGINNNGTVNVKNSIIAGNTGVRPDTNNIASQGYNLVGSCDDGGFVNGVNHDLVGSIAMPLNPKLGALANNGGPTQTMALLCNSPAIDAGTSSGAPATDQRGIARPQGAASDMGAFESNTVNTPPVLGTYPNTPVTAGGNVTVTPTLAPSDDGSIVSLTATAPGFTGSLTGNTTTGAITVTNATPIGTYSVTVTVTATDNCGAIATKTFTLIVNGPPPTCLSFLTKWNILPLSGANSTFGVAVNSVGDVYVADGSSHIQKFDPNGNFILSWGSASTDDCNGCLNLPYGVAVDSTDHVYVADLNNHRIQKFDSSGNPILTFGSFGTLDGQFNQPIDVVVDSGGNIYVADYNNHRIQKFMANGMHVQTWGSPGTGDGQFNHPQGVGVDSLGNVYVADSGNNRIQKFGASGNFLLKWGTTGVGKGQFNTPRGVRVDSADNVFVVDTSNARIQQFDTSGNSILTFGSFGSGDGQFNNPEMGVAFAPGGVIYVGDNVNHRVQKFINPNTPPVLGNYPSAGTINLGAGATVTPNTAPTDNGTISSITAAAPGFAGSFSVSPTTGVVTISNAGPVGNYTVTVTATDNCGATATSNTFSLAVVCDYVINPIEQAFVTIGGIGMVNVTGPGGCAWTATSNAPWITINGPSGGNGNGTVSYSVGTNPDALPRTGTMTISGSTITASQAAAGVLVYTDFNQGIPSDWSVIHNGTGTYPNNQPATWSAGNPCNRVIPPPFSGSFAIVDASCAGPNAILDEQLITPAFNATGVGAVYVEFFNRFGGIGAANNIGDVDVSLDGGATWPINVHRFQNVDEGFPTPTTSSFDITALIAGSPTNVRVREHYTGFGLALPRQSLRPEAQEIYWAMDFSIYTFMLSSTSQSFPAGGSTGNISVTSSTAIPPTKGAWTATSNAPWITLGAQGGTGNGSIGYTVAPNPTASPRTGTMTIAGNTFTVMQGACTPATINPATMPNGFVNAAYSQTLTASGGAAPYAFSVSAGTLPNGLTLSSGGLLSGTPTTNGTFSFSVTATDASLCTSTPQAYTVIISGDGLVFYPLPRPVRLLDTRDNSGNCDNVGTPITGGTSLTTLARLTCEGITIPATAKAITGNLTVINRTSQIGFLTIYPDGQPLPLAANMVYEPNGILSNNFTVGLSADGKFNVYGEKTLDAIVDISGYYAPPGAGGLFYHPLSKPVRLLDTRPNSGNCDSVGAPINGGNSLTTLARATCEGLTIPAAAQAIVGNATVINGSGQTGFLTIYPNGVPVPLAGNMVYFPGQILSNAFTVSLSANGEFNIFGERTIDMVIDVAGYYSNEATDANGPGLLFTPLVRPLRTLDTRAGQGNCDSVSIPITGGTSIATAGRLTCEGITIPVMAQTVLGNVTVINQTALAGFLTLYPDGVVQPVVGNMVYFPNQILSNAFVVGLNAGTGQFRIFAERTLDAIVDVSGYFAP